MKPIALLTWRFLVNTTENLACALRQAFTTALLP
jgi:hypothetical protein